MPRHSNNDIDGMEMWKEKSRNDIDKVYEIDTHGKVAVIVRGSFIRLHVYPTTSINPCYRFDLPSICDSEIDMQSNSDLPYDRQRHRKVKTWKTFYQKIRQLIKDEVTPTLIVHSSTTRTHLPIIIEQKHSYTAFLLSLSVIGIVIIGWILWYIFLKTSRTSSENDDSDDSYENNQYPIQKLNNSETDIISSQGDEPANSLFFHDNKNTNYISDSVENQDDKIHYENIQRLIEDLQQSKSVSPSIIGQILSDLIHQAINTDNIFSDLQKFLSYAPHFFHILRSIITNKRSYEPLNPTHFLQYQYLIDILHHSEFILTYLHRHHSHEKVFIMQILTQLYRILTSMNTNLHQHERM